MSAPRVGYLLKKFPRLSETFVLNEVLGLEALGLPLAVLSRRAPDDEPRHPQLARLVAPVEVLPPHRELDPWGELFAEDGAPPAEATEPDAARRGEWERLGRVVALLRALRHPRAPSLVAEALHLRRRARALGVAHVHVHFATDSAVAAMLLAMLGGPGYSVTAHAKDIYRATVDPWLLAEVVGRSRFTVTVCDANVEHLRSLLPDVAAARVRRLYNGVDLAAFTPPAAPRDPAHLLAVGRLVEKKGFDVFVDACARLAEKGVDFRATLVGDGDQREALARRVSERHLSDRVTLAGPLDQDDVRALMQRATVLCLPCRVGADGNRDALPTVLLEALAVGLPAVSTPVTGVPEILGRGAAGVLVPEDDPEATAEALAELLGDPERRAALAAAGRARAEELFDGRAAARTLAGWLRAEVDVAAGAEVPG